MLCELCYIYDRSLQKGAFAFFWEQIRDFGGRISPFLILNDSSDQTVKFGFHLSIQMFVLVYFGVSAKHETMIRKRVFIM